MRCAVLLMICLLLLSGCRRQESTAPTEAYTAPVSQTQPADEEVKRLNMTLDNGETLSLSVMGKKAEDRELYGVREIRVYRGDDLHQVISMVEAIEADGVDGIELGYTESVSLEAAAALKDVDFDGNADLEICAWCPNNAIPYYYWLWNKEKECFEYAFTLQLRDVDTEKRQLVAWYKVENGLYHTDYYRVNAEKELELLKREVEDVRP